MLRVRTAERRDIADVGRILAAAFADDPVARWLLPDGRGAEMLFRTLARFVHGPAGGIDLAVRDGRTVGAALWDLPTHEPAPWQRALAAPGLAGALRGHLTDGRALARAVIAHRPSEPLWRLAEIGVAEPGHGIGSVLMRERLARILGPSYLETSSERAAVFYERFGFVVRESFALPSGGPTIWTMYREGVS